MASERPKLPPGCTGPHAVGDYDYDDGMQRVTTYAIRSGHDHFAWGKTPEDAARDAWGRFEELHGITRERWEAMERDHRAMEALRANPGSCVCAEEWWASGHPPKDRRDMLTGLWDANIGQDGPVATRSDPADAILAALGHAPEALGEAEERRAAALDGDGVDNGE